MDLILLSLITVILYRHLWSDRIHLNDNALQKLSNYFIMA